MAGTADAVGTRELLASRPKQQPGPIRNLVAGGVGGICLVFIGHPLDTIKVRLQTQKPGQVQFRGMLDCAIRTVRYEGYCGLYKGMLAPILGVTPMFCIYFVGYGLGKRLQRKSPNQDLTSFQYFKAGIVAGFFKPLISTSTERIKCVLQIQQSMKGDAKYSGSLDCARQLFRKGGIRSVYRGAAITLLRDIPGSGIYFGSYQYILSSGGTSPMRVLVAGGVAGMSYWVWAIGPDVVKSRFQTAEDGRYTGTVHVFKELMKKEGSAALFRGLTPIVVRAFPANAACFLGYEVAVHILEVLFPHR